MSRHPDKTLIVGEIVTIMDAKCPHCGRHPETGIAAYSNDYIWNGTRWVLLDSYEGGVLSAHLAMRSETGNVTTMGMEG